MVVLIYLLITFISFISTQDYQVYNFTQKIDHFTFQDTKTFSQKYLIKDTYFNYTKKGPIIFYCGNEGPIEMFYRNSGFVTQTLPQEFNALVVFMEHRYFGQSWPFGNEDESLKKGNNQYLTSLQALNDYVEFLKWLKVHLGCKDDECPIIAVGGSYGGMLAAWIRMKFPNVVDAALAASAPIYQFVNREGLDPTKFYQIISSNYEQCQHKINIGYQILNHLLEEKSILFELKKKDHVYELLSQAMNTCQPVQNKTDVLNVRNYMDTAYSYMAMTNYPQETSFLKHLPAWPANYSCNAFEKINQNSTFFEIFSAIKNSTDTFYNFDQKLNCSDTSAGESAASDDNMDGWNVLACAEMVLPMYSTGKTDMFYNSTWDFDGYKKGCEEKYGVTPNQEWAINFYGGKNDKEMKGFSNIFFSNGRLDPWSGGSPTQYLGDNLPTFYMSQSAHHNDLRLPAEGDPESVIECRKQEISHIKKWIGFNEKQEHQF